ncbi:MAG: OmpA family protein [Rhizobiaceae bacterium]|jgi:outer membrane protein OmpA-like peptidoglycan-associated protein|nr:OmpA family protein [Rhizobiaceae bacterium]MBO6725371.1 OmpA family protein [Rhizobiaceae bacterium]
MPNKKAAILFASAIFVAGCTTDPFTGERKLSNTAGGALIGAGVGTVAGLVIGGSGNRNAALIGAGVGALAGAGVGAYMDNQEAELRAQLAGTGVSVTRVGENIILNMPSNITFPTDQDTVSTSFYPTLNAVAVVLAKFNRTLVDVYGHTDSTGDEGYNIDLSQRRALSVATYLNAQGIDSRRFFIQGYGESRPVATNATPEGRALNRRVEIQLTPLK